MGCGLRRRGRPLGGILMRLRGLLPPLARGESAGFGFIWGGFTVMKRYWVGMF